MSIDFIVRLIGMVVLAVVGVYWGTALGRAANVNPDPNTFSVEQYAFTIGLVGALTGLVLTPLLTTRPVRALRSLLTRLSAQSLFSALLGLIAGLISPPWRLFRFPNCQSQSATSCRSLASWSLAILASRFSSCAKMIFLPLCSPLPKAVGNPLPMAKNLPSLLRMAAPSCWTPA